MKRFFVWFGLVSLVLAGAVSYLANANPDGLDYVTERHGIAEHAEEHPLSGGPFADYALDGDDSFTGLAGVVGVVVTLVVAGGLFWLLRKKA
ncbi:PDGLE domain-containing protein [Saccharothrix obliqua]|uniref:PDGLE domain-containing protein n=1 Tax=Saccharothrix obliqua TaxID=2861747 RepID=UPI001C600047|nr:PDGLE domain-containing protein [Saccharothrix obliqua]MBW4721011.1 PDGLE domain-containing protein [Saccharothrix obliqua]